MNSRIYLVRTCYKDEQGVLMDDHATVWPSEIGAVVDASASWDPDPHNRYGVFGLQPGQQEPSNWCAGDNSVWLILSAAPEDVVSVFGRQSKARVAQLEWLCPHVEGASAKAVEWLRERGHHEPLYKGTATAGPRGLAAVGDYGLSEVGDYGVAIAGYKGTAMSGDNGKSLAGHKAHAASGSSGFAHVGDGGTAIGGVRGQALAGINSLAVAGALGHAQAGNLGQAQAGIGGRLTLSWHDGTTLRTTTAYVGEWAQGLPEGEEIKPNTPYRVDTNGNWAPVEVQPSEPSIET